MTRNLSDSKSARVSFFEEALSALPTASTTQHSGRVTFKALVKVTVEAVGRASEALAILEALSDSTRVGLPRPLMTQNLLSVADWDVPA